jgi:hypothetical protein
MGKSRVLWERKDRARAAKHCPTGREGREKMVLQKFNPF